MIFINLKAIVADFIESDGWTLATLDNARDYIDIWLDNLKDEINGDMQRIAKDVDEYQHAINLSNGTADFVGYRDGDKKGLVVYYNKTHQEWKINTPKMQEKALNGIAKRVLFLSKYFF